MASKGRDWCFTWNNKDCTDLTEAYSKMEKDKPGVVEYLVAQEETGNSGTRHLQGFLQLQSPRAMSFVKKLLPGAHLEMRKGTVKQAVEYCNKDDTRTGARMECGEVNQRASQGKRDDFGAWIRDIKHCMTRIGLMEKYPGIFVKHHKVRLGGLEQLDRVRSQFFVAHVCDGYCASP